MHRFLIDPSDIQDGRVHFAEEISLQMKKVLRLRNGNEVVVFDGGGVDYQVRLEVVETKTSLGTVLSANDSHNEPGIFITLYQALIRSERYEYALQKGVETGISRFVPFTSERTEVSNPSHSRMDRWRRIIKEAAEQSGRSVVPQLSDPILFPNMIRNLNPVALIPWEEEKNQSIRQILSKLRQDPGLDVTYIDLIIGPVGGFTSQEVLDAADYGATSVSLGKRILRSETAGIVAAVAVLYEFGDM
ncbi:MAG: 16S rRNA (uracil1498-N3)-methyltransferase [Chloroflexi bacterium]|jgi:16S rRNA (uracil1498-N3)-methyltransferase|nr:MAG: 16S rRNA (uracil1498-N3)-methyltransferase [Chloroflexota bacterium]